MLQGKLSITSKNVNLNPYLTPYTKISSKWTTDLEAEPETIKLLGENLRKNLHNIEFGHDFLDMTWKAQLIKAKLDKWDYTTL